jgi:predicted ATPase/Tfp pilus assembly protein PilF
MSEHLPLRLLASRLARDRPIDWDAEEHAAGTKEERETVRQLRMVAAMAAFHRTVQSGDAGEDLSSSISLAKTIAGEEGAGEADSPSIAAPSLSPGSRWGQLEILERVGRGAFGDVFRARDVRLDREVALKMLSRQSSDPLVEGEAVREARLLARVNHPNVVTVYGADRIEGRVGIWMEFLRGETLEQIRKERGVLDACEAALVGIDICRALSAVHAAGIAHRDVKLTNVMRVQDGRIVLMDFGLGREADPGGRRRRSRTQTLSGTPLFMAPEVLRGGREDSRSDLYSLGVVLFALVTGGLPVEAASFSELIAKHDRDEIRRARDLIPDLPVAFARVLDCLLAPDPGDRFASADDAERALVQCVERPASRSPVNDGVSHRLPGEMDAFVGRERDLAELGERLLGDERLVTLLGAGGMGKTRLVVRFGWQSLGKWPGGVWFSDLTEARSAEDIASAVAASLGVVLVKGDPIGQLGHAIAGHGRCLMICDNFEQVTGDAGATVGQWLESAGEARFLVTSRERLNVRGEGVQDVEPLQPESGAELFVDRARRQQRGFEPEGSEAEAVEEVVRLTEGIPLAIELAAARVRVMSVGVLAKRMRERFRVLGRPGGGRHSSFKAVIDGSWETLLDWEKAVWAQCAVFEGGFTLEAAEGVLDLSAWPKAPWIVDVIQSLVDKSLLRTLLPEAGSGGDTPETRFGMFVTLQEYARTKLRDEAAIASGGSGEEAMHAAEERHGKWYAQYGTDEAVAAHVRHGGMELRRQVEREIQNVLTACRRAIERGDGEIATAAFKASGIVLNPQGRPGTVVELGQMMLADLQLGREKRAHVLRTMGIAEWYSGRMGEARGHFEDELIIQREMGDRRREGAVLGNLGILHHEQGRMEETRAYYEAALAISRETGDRFREGLILGNLGALHVEQGRMEEARTDVEAALAIHREVGNRQSEGISIADLGTLHKDQGRLEEARAHYEAALVIHREVGDRRSEGIALRNLGDLHAAQGRLEEAGAHYDAALATHREVGERSYEGAVLGCMGALFHLEGRIEEARAALTTGEAILRQSGARLELGKLLSARAELELASGNAAAARAIVDEAEALAAQIGSGPDSELGHMLAQLRQALSSGGGR